MSFALSGGMRSSSPHTSHPKHSSTAPELMRHILIIDDDAAIRDSVEFLLRSSGFTTVTAANGREGLGRCTERQPDLVITDLLMPEMEGIETIRALRRRYTDLPIIAMSGGGFGGATGYLFAAAKLGSTQTLSKPFGLETLLAAIEKCWQCPFERSAPAAAA